MSDMIDGSKFVYTYQPAWHGKGNKIEPGIKIREAVTRCGLDYDVVKAPMYYHYREHDDVISGTGFTRAQNLSLLLRKVDGKQYGVVSDNKYTIMQNMEAFEKLQGILDDGVMELDCMGALMAGEIAWALLTPSDKIQLEVQDGDSVTQHILMVVNHDGRTANSLGTTDVRVVCNNTMNAAMNSELTKLLRIRHSSKIDESTDLAIQAIDVARKKFVADVELYRKLAKSSISRDSLVKYVEITLNVEGRESTRAENIKGRVLDLVRGETAWDAYNAITEYTTHLYGKDGDKRLTSLWFGNNKNVNKNALVNALKMVA